MLYLYNIFMIVSLVLFHQKVQKTSDYGKMVNQKPECEPEAVVKVYGVLANPGKRKDLEIVCELVYEGLPTRHIVPELSSFRGIRKAELVLKYFEQGRKFKDVRCLTVGPSGHREDKIRQRQASR